MKLLARLNPSTFANGFLTHHLEGYYLFKECYFSLDGESGGERARQLFMQSLDLAALISSFANGPF